MLKKTKSEIIYNVKKQLLEEWIKFKHVFEDIEEFEMPIYNYIKNNLFSLDDNDLSKIGDALSYLMKRLEKYYHQKVMLFIDEYDTPFIEAHVNGFYQEVKNGLSSLLHNSLKLSNSLQYAMVTGIQRVAKENVFSDLNNLFVCSVKDDEYSQYFGFNELETKELLAYYNLELNKKVQLMYNGYHIGKLKIYNPWSIINYAQRKKLDPYWLNTSSNTMIKKAMNQADQAFKDGFEKLIEQGSLETSVLMETSFFEQSETKSLWGLFINAGYLTIDAIIVANRYRIKIPNQEVRNEFKALTAHYLKVSNTTLEDLFYAIYSGNKKMFECSYQALLLSLTSSHDLKDENSYYMMSLGLCAGLSSEYEIKSNREAGKGRYDIMLKAKNKLPSYIMEFKYMKKVSNKDLDFNKLVQLANEAIEQIKQRHYDYEISKPVIYLGLAHCGKDVVISWQENN